MEVSGDIGGIPELTAVFVAVTGVSGAVVGEILLARVPVRSTLALGAALGMAARGVDTAHAYEIGRGEGSIAGLVMVLAEYSGRTVFSLVSTLADCFYTRSP